MYSRKCSLIGVVHVLPLPGSHGWRGSMEEVLGAALEDGLTYKEAGVDALIIENMHDAPFLKGRVEPETTAAMTAIAKALKYEAMMPLGIQILAGANLEALAVAVAAGLDFIRVEGFVYAHVGDEGIHESDAALLLRRRASLKAENVQIFADIKKKHSAHAITGDVTLAETAQAAEFFGADGVIVSGRYTGDQTDVQDVLTARSLISKPVLVGSGVSSENIHLYIPHADAVIVGSSVKYGSRWCNPVDGQKVRELVEHMMSQSSASRSSS